MPTMSTKIPEKLKNKVVRLPHINWSDVMRAAITKKVDEEEAKISSRDHGSIKQSIEMMDELRRETSGDTTKELRAWRELRH